MTWYYSAGRPVPVVSLDAEVTGDDDYLQQNSSVSVCPNLIMLLAQYQLVIAVECGNNPLK